MQLKRRAAAESLTSACSAYTVVEGIRESRISKKSLERTLRKLDPCPLAVPPNHDTLPDKDPPNGDQ